MKITRTSPFLVLALTGLASAEVIYSSLQDIPIPQTNNGVYLNVLTGIDSTTDWHINPTFGGINVYNSANFQPLRETASGLGTLSNIPVGGQISSASEFFATGFGASGNHLGSGKPFTAGSEGYLGFSVVDGMDTHYGWMRVVFTGTGSPLIKDWAYDTSGGSIAAGNVLQSGSTFTLDSSTQSFGLGSAIAGLNSVVKTGANTVTLNATNTYSGITSINAGTLALAATGSIANSSTITVGPGAILDVSAVSGAWTVGPSQTLGGSGTVGGNTAISGTLAPGNSPGVLSFSNDLTLNSTASTQMEILGLNRSTDYDGINVGGTLVLDGNLVLFLGTTFGVGTHTFNLFDVTGSTTGDFATVALTGAYGEIGMTPNSGIWSTTTNSGNETWTFTQSTGSLSLTVIPEPRAALLGGLGLLALLRRRRP